MSNFQKFAQLIHARYTALAKHELFVVGTDKHAISDTYLAAFPPGTNPVYKTNTEHDCTCCKNWLRNLGNVVAIVDGELMTVWDDFGAFPDPYASVACTMNIYIRNLPITGIFRSSEPKYGNEFNMQQLEDGSAKRWNHFHGTVQPRHFTKEVGTVVGQYNGSVDVFRRGLHELTSEALDQVSELITAKALYRGEEHYAAVRAFATAHRQHHALGDAARRELFIWANAGQHYARFRNTVIGTLVQDLSEGVDLEQAVKSFETKVAPTNYKRPTALITPAMIQNAMKTINEMGLEPALQRRFAKISDVTVNNVLWVDNSVKGKMKGGIEGLLMGAVTPAPVADIRATDIAMRNFMLDVLPTAVSIDMLVQNNHTGNFMSLTAPVHPDTGKLFKWDNDFAWSYSGNVADSIKERVKKAGGKVEGDVCCRLSWDNRSDLDFHMYEPANSRVSFDTYRRRLSPNGGVLDLDANGCDGEREDPAENIVYENAKKMRDGVYRLGVHVYRKQDSGHKDFEVEVEIGGTLHYFKYTQPWKSYETIFIAELTKKGDTIEVKPLLEGSMSRPSKTIWGVKTEQFVKVNTLMYSPNYWDRNEIGNKHYMFMLDGCLNPEPTRGIYNEFLNSALEQHRKVFEILGDKTKCAVTDEQLSGLGFSSTKSDVVTVKVTTATSTRAYNINF
jgi:hypothetical protein